MSSQFTQNPVAPAENGRRAREEALISAYGDNHELSIALAAAHRREDAIRALPRFDLVERMYEITRREVSSRGDYIDADDLYAILDGAEASA